MTKRDELVEHGRVAFGQGQWSAARAALSDADADQPLAVDDLERLAWSCRWIGDSLGFPNALERAEVAFGPRRQGRLRGWRPGAQWHPRICAGGGVPFQEIVDTMSQDIVDTS